MEPRFERGLERMKFETRIEGGVKRVEPPLKRAALAIDRNIKKVVPKKE